MNTATAVVRPKKKVLVFGFNEKELGVMFRFNSKKSKADPGNARSVVSLEFCRCETLKKSYLNKRKTNN